MIIDAINSGTIPKKPRTVTVTEETHPTQGRDRAPRGGKGTKGGKTGDRHQGRGQSSGRGGGKGDRGGSGKRMRSATPGPANSEPTCTRCKYPGHSYKQCYATYDSEGNTLTSDKPVEVPEGARTRSKTRHAQAYVTEGYEDPGDNEGFFYTGPVARRGQAFTVSGQAATLSTSEEKGPINPPPPRGSPFRFIPACFQSLWFLILCAGMIPATMATVAKDQKDFLWKGVQVVSIMFVVLGAGFMISTIMSTGATQPELSSPVLEPWDPNISFAPALAPWEPTIFSPVKTEMAPAVYSPTSTPGPSFISPEHASEHSSSEIPSPSSELFSEHASGEIFTATLGVKKGTRKVLIDSGANILLAPNDINMTDVTKKTYHVTGVHGTSSLDFVGRLPTLVTNMGDKLHFKVECPINLTTTGLREDRTIVAPTLLNDMGITVLLQDNTTVLLRTSTVKISGEIVHQEKFADGLSYIHVEDNGTPRRGAGFIQAVDTTRPYIRTQHVRGNLRGQTALAARANFQNL